MNRPKPDGDAIFSEDGSTCLTSDGALYIHAKGEGWRRVKGPPAIVPEPSLAPPGPPDPPTIGTGGGDGGGSDEDPPLSRATARQIAARLGAAGPYILASMPPGAEIVLFHGGSAALDGMLRDIKSIVGAYVQAARDRHSENILRKNFPGFFPPEEGEEWKGK